MTDPAKYKPHSSTAAQLNKLAKEISIFAYNAPEEQKEALLRLLNDWQIRSLLEAWQKTDRRREPRRPCSLTVQFVVEEQLMTEVIKNATTEGVLLETVAPLRAGQEITMTIWPATMKEPVEATGEIVWRGDDGVGVRFATPVTKELREVIDAL